jgi:PLP dependent protein
MGAPAFLLSRRDAAYNPRPMSYSSLPERLASVRSRMARACDRAGRDPAEVTIVAVTKTHPPEAVRAAIEAGLTEVAENRVQELDEKVAAVGREAVRWHLIGHLQRNKARRALELADLIHSVDSLRLARKLSEEAVAGERTVQALVQVNLSGEASKGGLEEAKAVEEIVEICSLPGLRVQGLMTMAPFSDDMRIVREVFAATRRLRDAARDVPGFQAAHLSMGMSNDFEVAVEEGSTLVRLGTVLLGERGE